jgi:hypothetical protein
MRFTIALRFVATTLFAAGTSAAGAQLSSRSASGGLFNSLVDWNPVAEQALLGVGDVRMSPWYASRVQLGTVRAADPNRPWMGYWGHYQDRELADVIGAEHSLRANPIALLSSTNRGQPPLFVAPPPGSNSSSDGAAGGIATQSDQGEAGGKQPLFPAVAQGNPAPLVTNVGAANVIVNPEPSVYLMAVVGLGIIALIRRFRMA